MSHDIFKPSNLIGCLENKTADSAQTRKRAIVTRPFPSPGGRGLGTRLPDAVQGESVCESCITLRLLVTKHVEHTGKHGVYLYKLYKRYITWSQYVYMACYQ